MFERDLDDYEIEMICDAKGITMRNIKDKYNHISQNSLKKIMRHGVVIRNGYSPVNTVCFGSKFDLRPSHGILAQVYTDSGSGMYTIGYYTTEGSFGVCIIHKSNIVFTWVDPEMFFNRPKFQYPVEVLPTVNTP